MPTLFIVLHISNGVAKSADFLRHRWRYFRNLKKPANWANYLTSWPLAAILSLKMALPSLFLAFISFFSALLCCKTKCTWKMRLIVCPKKSWPNLYSNLLYKMGQKMKLPFRYGNYLFRQLKFWLNILFRSRLSIMLFPPVMTAIISQSFYLADFFTRAFVDLLFRNIKNYMNFMQKNFTLSPEPRQVALHRTLKFC